LDSAAFLLASLKYFTLAAVGLLMWSVFVIDWRARVLSRSGHDFSDVPDPYSSLSWRRMDFINSALSGRFASIDDRILRLAVRGFRISFACLLISALLLTAVAFMHPQWIDRIAS
jgi:hypothetical protein